MALYHFLSVMKYYLLRTCSHRLVLHARGGVSPFTLIIFVHDLESKRKVTTEYVEISRSWLLNQCTMWPELSSVDQCLTCKIIHKSLRGDNEQSNTFYNAMCVSDSLQTKYHRVQRDGSKTALHEWWLVLYNRKHNVEQYSTYRVFP